MNTYSFKNRELSWLDFNERVLQEAEDISVPLIERLRFIGIFSNNLDPLFFFNFVLYSEDTSKNSLVKYSNIDPASLAFLFLINFFRVLSRSLNDLDC